MNTPQATSADNPQRRTRQSASAAARRGDPALRRSGDVSALLQSAHRPRTSPVKLVDHVTQRQPTTSCKMFTVTGCPRDTSAQQVNVIHNSFTPAQNLPHLHVGCHQPVTVQCWVYVSRRPETTCVVLRRVCLFVSVCLSVCLSARNKR